MSMHARDCKCCVIYLYNHCSIAIGFGNVSSIGMLHWIISLHVA